MACEAALPRRIQDEHAGAALAASRIPIANVAFLDIEKKVALVPACTDPTKMARVDLREVKNGGVPARACGGGEGWRGLVEDHELGLEDGALEAAVRRR
jgi:hypothetical protein